QRRKHAIGDVMGRCAQAMLEFLQPYPGDEREMDESRCHHNRFDLCRVSDKDYTISDAYYREITILPVALLRDPTFEIAAWYSWQR
ncbi:hypothetical protein DFH07DRAFT_719865, partial [Mycena maculata]